MPRCSAFSCFTGSLWQVQPLQFDANQSVHPPFKKQIRWNRQYRGTSFIACRCRRGQCKHVRRESMTNRFMISVAAAALIAGTGFASAQGTGGREGASGGATVQQSAPSPDRAAPSAAPTSRDATESTKPSSGMKATQSEDKAAPGATKRMGAQDDMKPGAKPEKSAQDNNNMKGEKSKSMSSETATDKPAGNNMKADSKTPTDTKAGATNSENKTTGNAATSATAAPPAEKQTQIASAIRSEKIEETTNVNFEINIGTRIPATVHFYPLPPRIVEIYPEWRGYEVIRVHGRYVIVRPQTREIVYVIEG
jgi:hypothetical protein